MVWFRLFNFFPVTLDIKINIKKYQVIDVATHVLKVTTSFINLKADKSSLTTFYRGSYYYWEKTQLELLLKTMQLKSERIVCPRTLLYFIKATVITFILLLNRTLTT